MIKAQYINLNMIPSGVMPVLYCSQYDVGRTLGMVVYNGSEAVDLSTYTVTIEGTRTDGTPITAAVTTDGNIGAFETTATMTNVPDFYKSQLVLTDGSGKRVASIRFMMKVNEAAMNENSEGIQEDASLYQQYTGTVQTLISAVRADLLAEANRAQAAEAAEASARASADASLQSAIASEASTRAAADQNLQAQVNQIIAPSGEAPSAAEVQNARIGADNVTYPTLGDAIRGQVTNLKNHLEVIYDSSVFYVTQSAATTETAYISMDDKTLHNSSSWMAYKFDNTDGKYKCVKFRVHSDASKYCVAFYSSLTPSSASFISGWNDNTTGIKEGLISVPSNAVLIVVSNRTASLATPTVNIGLTTSDIYNDVVTLKDAYFPADGLEKSTGQFYVKTDRTIAFSSSWKSYVFKNIGYKSVKAEVFIGNSQMPIAFYTSETPNDASFLSGITNITSNTVSTYEAIVPETAKSIVVCNRYDSYQTSSIWFNVDQSAACKQLLNDINNERLHQIKAFGETVEVDSHRGSTVKGEAENTIGAYYDAYLLGATSVEVDARRSQDGVYFCCHDATITGIDEDTQTSVTYTIASTNSSLLSKVIVNSSSKYGIQKMPTIADVLNLAYKTGLKINLDMKDIASDITQAAAISTELATLVHESGMSGRVIYATNGGEMTSVNAVLAIDTDAFFIDRPGNWITNVPNYQNRVYAYIPTADWTEQGYAIVKAIGCLLCISSVTAANFNDFIGYHPDMVEFETDVNFNEVLGVYFAALPY